MKLTIPSLLAALLAALSFTACEDNVSEDLEDKLSGFVTCMTDGRGQITEMKDDFGQRFKVYDSRYILDKNSSYRRICTYTIGKDSTAVIHDMAVPNCHEAADISATSLDYLESDPFDIESAYTGGGYLNIVLKIMTHDETSFRRHYLEAVRISSPDSLVFSIVHNDNGDIPVYTKKLYFCIPLSNYGLGKNSAVFFKYRNYREEDCCLKFAY